MIFSIISNISLQGNRSSFRILSRLTNRSQNHIPAKRIQELNFLPLSISSQLTSTGSKPVLWIRIRIKVKSMTRIWIRIKLISWIRIRIRSICRWQVKTYEPPLDPHKIERYDPDPDQRNKLDPALDLPPKQNDKQDSDLDPHQFADGKPKCKENEPIWSPFQGFEPLFGSLDRDPDPPQSDKQVRFRICIRVTSRIRIRIRIKMMRIRNTVRNPPGPG